MIIREVQMRDFMAHADTSIALPETGVVLITGENGSGKSSIIEAIAHAVFGKSVRGDWGWQDDEGKPRGWTSEVLVQTDRIRVHRAKGRGSPSMEWTQTHNAAGGEIPNASVETYGTTTKAQAALEHIVGSFDLWVRAHVFSSSDAAHFTLATDSERKRLLEQMLGIDYFDSAAKLAKTNHAKAEARFADIRGNLSLIESQRSIAAAELKAAQEFLARTKPEFTAPPAVPDLVLPPEPDYPAAPVIPEPDAPDAHIEEMRASLGRVDKHIAAVDEDIAEARDASKEHNRALDNARFKLERAAKELEQWPGGKCPTCNQDVPEELLAPLVEKSEALRAEAEREQDTAQTRLVHVEEQIAEIQNERNVLTGRRRALADQISQHDNRRITQREHAVVLTKQHEGTVASLKVSWERECALLKREHDAQVRAREETLADQQRQMVEWATNSTHYEEQEAAANLRLHELDEQEEELNDQLSDAEWSLHKCTAVVNVFGLKGMRAHVLGQALTGLQDLGNDWLTSIGKPGQKLALREYTETKRGNTNAALSLELSSNRRPRWHKYRAASGGERRRIDVALILALAEVGRAARGKSRGTLFFDEVFDALDADGIDSVSDAIHDLAQDRCVVVISHSADLVSKLQPVLKLHAEDGVIR